MAFVIECAFCAVLFAIILQLRQDKVQVFLLLLPSIGLIVCAVKFLLHPEIDVHIYARYGLISLSAASAVWFILSIVKSRKDKTVAGRFKRRCYIAAMSAPLSLIVGLLLTMFEIGDDTGTLVCLSVAVFGGVALLISLNLILMSLTGTGNTRESFRRISQLYQQKKLTFLRIVLAKDVFLVLAKTLLSIMALSFFMFANALYSAGLGVARFIAVKMHTQNRESQIKSYFHVGAVIFAASLAYVIYSIRLFFKSEMPTYDMIVGIAIACYTFFEFGLNIREAWRFRKSDALETKALRAISLASTLLCFVLTQTALMSFADDGDSSFANAIAGIVFGGSAALVGLYVMVKSKTLKSQQLFHHNS